MKLFFFRETCLFYRVDSTKLSHLLLSKLTDKSTRSWSRKYNNTNKTPKTTKYSNPTTKVWLRLLPWPNGATALEVKVQSCIQTNAKKTTKYNNSENKQCLSLLPWPEKHRQLEGERNNKKRDRELTYKYKYEFSYSVVEYQRSHAKISV